MNQNDIDALLAAEDGGDPAAEPSGRSHAEKPQVQPSKKSVRDAATAAHEEGPHPATQASPRPFDPQPLNASASAGVDARRVTMLSDVSLRVRIELGRTRMRVEDVLKLDEGSVVELDKLAGDPVDVYVNDRLIARGEVLVLNDNFCVRISEVVSNDPHRVMV